MSPRAAKIDREATRKRKFLDNHSFVGMDGHDYLRGKDVEILRMKVYDRDRGICQQCLRLGSEHFTDWNAGEMHHKQGGLVGRHDDLSNVEWICRPHHRETHVQVRWSVKGKTQ